MKYGLGLYTGQVPPGSDHSFQQEYARILEQAMLADHLGIDSIWLSEHHGAADGYLPSMLPLAAAVLAVTTRVKVGTAVLLAPFHDPLRLAEDVALLDQLSGGRFILGLGTGWRSAEFRAFGIDPRTRARRLEETVAILRLAWAGERFSFDGITRRIDDAIVRPGPLTEGGPPIWLGGTGPRALARAGRVGDGHFAPSAPHEAAFASFDRALDACDPARRPGFAFGQLRSGFIHDDPEAAWALTRRGMTYTLDVHADWAAEERGDPPGAGADPAAVRSYNLIGTPADVVAGLEPYQRRFADHGDSHLAFRLYHPYMPLDDVLAAIQRYGTEVIPVLRSAQA